MDNINVTAKTLEDAITKACVELGVTSDRLVYTIIDKGSRGFFGLGARPCIISAGERLSDSTDLINKPGSEKRKDQEKTKIKENVKAPKNTQKLSDSTKKKNAGKSEDPSDKARGKRKLKFEKRAGQGTIEKEKKAASRDKAGKSEASSRTKNINRHSFTNNLDNNEVKENTGAGVKSFTKGKKGESRPVVLTEDPVERANSFLNGLFKTIDIKVNISGRYIEEDRELVINLSGEDMNLLIGNRGQTLDALQYLTAQIVNKRQTGYIRVKLDIESYREKRLETLENIGKQMADKVRKTNRPMVLEPMNAYERRVIHSAIQVEEGVTTHSEGEEPYRHVVIMPAKKKERRLISKTTKGLVVDKSPDEVDEVVRPTETEQDSDEKQID